MSAGHDPRPLLQDVWGILRRLWGAKVPDLDLEALSDEEVRLELVKAGRRRRALTEGELAGWRPKERYG